MDFDKEKVKEWIDTYWKPPRRCPVCGEDKWLLMDKVWELREFHGGGIVLSDAVVIPVVVLMCNVCGHTVLFNAVAARALPRRTSEEV
jgi:rubrerythrin